MLHRRDFLAALAAALAAPGLARAADRDPRFGPWQPFSYEGLAEEARRMAGEPYRPRTRPAPEVVERIDYEALGHIRFRPDEALFASGPGRYPATFFHLGRFQPTPVAIHVVEDGRAAEFRYAPDFFEMPADSPARRMPEGAGFAGFRLQEARDRDDWRTQDWVAFLGASYFRAIGSLGQYGLSARGIAIDVATPTGEEFPDFTRFYIDPAGGPDDAVTVYALLDGPSIAGAYRIVLRRGEGVVTDVENRLFMRRGVTRLGIAPLSSMMWYAQHNRPFMTDWRPEVHDSDSLELWTGAGERIWRPLNNPPRVITSSFLDADPRGFGFMQRDREFGHYLDGVRYERRPSVWIEPLDSWGEGSVQLVEIPTDDEIHDNVTAFWVPAGAAEAGDSYRFRYRLHWQGDHPQPAPDLARTVATRIGRGGAPGRPRPPGVQKFVVEFAGDRIANLPADAGPKVNVSASRGETSLVFAEPVPGTPRWRAVFDVAATGPEPVELRLFLSLDGAPLTETWLYQHLPELMPWPT